MQQRKVEGIQQLRGICVFLTALAHLPLATLPFALLGISAPYIVGVSIFYGISGWIIAYVTDNLTVRSIGNFYIKRFFRIAPVLYMTLLAALVISLILPHFPAVDQFYPDLPLLWKTIYANLTFSADLAPYQGISAPLSLLGLWSISVEVKFYLVYGCLLALSARFRLPALLCLLLLIAITRCYYMTIGSQLPYSHVFYIELFALGAISYHLKNINVNNVFLNCLSWIWIFVFHCLSLKGNAYLLGYAGFCLAVIYVVNFMIRGKIHLAWLGNSLYWLGERSYVYYVFHFQFLAVSGMVGQALHLNRNYPILYSVVLILGLIAGLPVTEFLHRTIEKRGIELGRKVSYLFSREFWYERPLAYFTKNSAD